MQLQLSGHEAKILVLSDVQLTRPASKSRGSRYYPAASATLSGQAAVADCSNTSHYCLRTKSKVGNLYPGSSALFTSVDVPASGSNSSTKVVGVNFINYDVAFTTGDNTRNLAISVNGGTPKRWAFPISGGDWYGTGRLDIELTGFVEGNRNTALVAADASGSTAAPDLVGLEVFS
jgi:alpha-galactosidase